MQPEHRKELDGIYRTPGQKLIYALGMLSDVVDCGMERGEKDTHILDAREIIIEAMREIPDDTLMRDSRKKDPEPVRRDEVYVLSSATRLLASIVKSEAILAQGCGMIGYCENMGKCRECSRKADCQSLLMISDKLSETCRHAVKGT